MFTLIIALVAIALTIFTALVTINYLGDQADKSAKAEFMKIFNESQQIAGAISIYKNHGNFITELFQLSDLQRDDYLSSLPPTDWRIEPNTLFTPVTMNVCYEANKELGLDYSLDEPDIYIDELYPDKPVPYCSKEGLAKSTICCYSPATGTEVGAPSGM